MDAVNPLNYAPRPRVAQRLWRWVYRLVFVGAIVVAAILWGPGLLRHIKSIYWEQKCLAFVQSPSHVVYETNGGNIVHSEVCVLQSRMEGNQDKRAAIGVCTIFLHEMRRPDGTRSLVALSDSLANMNGGFTLRCQQWTLSLSPQLLKWNDVSFLTEPIDTGHWKFFAGQPDANNPSHFTFDYEWNGTRFTCDAWLNNDGELIVSQRP